MDEKKNKKGLKVYSIIITIAAVLFLAAFIGVFFYSGLSDKVLIKLGLKEDEYWTEERIFARGWQLSLEKQDISCDAAFFGDSLTQNSDFRDYFPDTDIIELGVGGDYISMMTDRLFTLQAVHPSKVFVMGGINNLINGMSVETSLSDYAAMLDYMIEYLPGSEIYVQSVLPISEYAEELYCSNDKVYEFNQGIKALAEERGLTYIDIFPAYLTEEGSLPDYLTTDGVHLSFPEGYDIWADAISVYINE